MFQSSWLCKQKDYHLNIPNVLLCYYVYIIFFSLFKAIYSNWDHIVSQHLLFFLSIPIKLCFQMNLL